MTFLFTGIELNARRREFRRVVQDTLAASLAFLLFVVAPLEAGGQARDSVDVVLPEVRVIATRGMGKEFTSPFSLISVRRPDHVVDTSPGISLEQTLRGVPGLFISSRNHFAVGERLVIRGMGSRAPFGVRGIQVVLDGIPLTLPDGQSVAGIVDPGMITSVQLIRGPASVFWGNGSGGALFFSTNRPRNNFPTRIKVQAGSYGLRQASAETNFQVSGHSFRAYASSISLDGYRDHSSGRFTRGALFARINAGNRVVLNVIAAVADQRADHPGSLKLDQLEEDPTQANGFFKSRLAGKDSRQVQVGTRLFAATDAGLITASAHYIMRALRNPLPFAFIDLDRKAGGVDVSLQRESDQWVWAVGADLRFQNDQRENWNTVEGERGTDQSLDQTENVLNTSARSIVMYTPTDRLQLAAGARFDYVKFDMEDHLLSNGDQSGDRTFDAVSPVVGFSYQLDGATIYADVGSAFETPTTTELVNRPNLTGGFNPQLDAQKTRGIEGGIRLRSDANHVSADIALYRLAIGDRLVAFQTEEGGERTFFRNGGKNINSGIEAAVVWDPVPYFRINASGSKGTFEFQEEDLKGNRLPGVPEVQFFLEAEVSPGDIRARFSLLYTDSYFVNDANTISTDAYSLVDVNLSHIGIPLGSAIVRPFFQISNLFDKTYVSSVSINSSSGSYFDPGSGRSVQAGVNVLF
ncbi:MAG: TonB-dependent receptor [Rhodothermia bacterium]|nr:MAG: TonB-dependent receptor [Rhodothermia bacterium]